MQWRAFTHQNKTYSLDHLDSKTILYEQPGKADKPARKYSVEVDFSLHCFTRGIVANEQIDKTLLYADRREQRVFDFQRYELSKLLPEIVADLPNRKCYHTGKGNFFCVELVDQRGVKIEYDVFFEASRTQTKALLRLFVQSAYVRDKKHKSNRPHKKPIGFFVILFNTLNQKPIKIPE